MGAGRRGTDTECLGGGSVETGEEHLGLNYQTQCDPRLNYTQSLDMAVEVAEQCVAQQGTRLAM